MPDQNCTAGTSKLRCNPVLCEPCEILCHSARRITTLLQFSYRLTRLHDFYASYNSILMAVLVRINLVLTTFLQSTNLVRITLGTNGKIWIFSPGSSRCVYPRHWRLLRSSRMMHPCFISRNDRLKKIVICRMSLKNFLGNPKPCSLVFGSQSIKYKS